MSFLGKGIDAIDVNSFSLDIENHNINLSKNISVDKISIGKYQPRKKDTISKESIQDLVKSICEHGVLQPIIVRTLVNNRYELIAGERRYLSAVEAGLKEIPCIIKEVNEKDAFAIALIENIQREQLSVLEESESILKLKEQFFLSSEEVSKLIGKPRTTVANLVRVAKLLSPDGKRLLEQNMIDLGHVRAVLTLDHDIQNIVLEYVVNNKMTVRETEKIVREEAYYSLKDKSEKNIPLLSKQEASLKDVWEKMSQALNKNIQMKLLQSGKIKVSIVFENVHNVYDYLIENYSENESK